MPELPDVEVFKQYADATALHQTIEGLDVTRDEVLNLPEQELKAHVTGRRFESTRRHGKHLFLRMEPDNWLMLHFGMTGELKYFKKENQAPVHTRVLFHFDNGYHLAYDCQRLLGEVDITDDLENYIKERELGPDALSLDFDSFKARLENRRGMIKSALMNQEIIAGIGNVYSDEILFQARLHPKTKVSDLDKDTLKTLFDAMRDVLQTAIDCQADPDQFPASFLIPHRSKDDDCPQDGGEVTQIKVSGRNAYYCPDCQKMPS